MPLRPKPLGQPAEVSTRLLHLMWPAAVVLKCAGIRKVTNSSGHCDRKRVAFLRMQVMTKITGLDGYFLSEFRKNELLPYFSAWDENWAHSSGYVCLSCDEAS